MSLEPRGEVDGTLRVAAALNAKAGWTIVDERPGVLEDDKDNREG